MDGRMDGWCKKFVYQIPNYGERKFQQSTLLSQLLPLKMD
jgi:hypothetical protein